MTSFLLEPNKRIYAFRDLFLFYVLSLNPVLTIFFITQRKSGSAIGAAVWFCNMVLHIT